MRLVVGFVAGATVSLDQSPNRTRHERVCPDQPPADVVEEVGE